MESRTYKLLLTVTCLIIAVPPYFRGLYFEREQFITYILSLSLFIILIVIKTRKKEPILLNSYLDYTLIALVVTYIISTSVAVNLRLAISEALKYFNYFIIYFLIKELIKEHRHIKIMLNVILISITGVSLVGLGAAAGTIQYNGAYSESNHWISSTIQYHNAFGTFMLCGLLLCYGLYCITDKRWLKSIYSISGYLLLLGFIFSYSRGSWIVFPVVFVILVILTWKQALLEIIVFTISICSPSVMSMQGFNSAILLKNEVSAWLWLVIGLIITILTNQLLQIMSKRIKKIQINRKVILISIGTILVLLLLTINLIPQELLERLKGISFTARTVQERFIFYKDALKIVKDYPILGAGGGAWPSLYFMYQSYMYWSTQAHSYIMQIWVETGTIGIIIFVGVLISFLYTAIINSRTYAKEREVYLIQVAIFTAASSLIIHSFIDFDLSISAISIVLWALFALTATLKKEKTNNNKDIRVVHISSDYYMSTHYKLISISNKLCKKRHV